MRPPGALAGPPAQHPDEVVSPADLTDFANKIIDDSATLAQDAKAPLLLRLLVAELKLTTRALDPDNHTVILLEDYEAALRSQLISVRGKEEAQLLLTALRALPKESRLMTLPKIPALSRTATEEEQEKHALAVQLHDARSTFHIRLSSEAMTYLRRQLPARIFSLIAQHTDARKALQHLADLVTPAKERELERVVNDLRTRAHTVYTINDALTFLEAFNAYQDRIATHFHTEFRNIVARQLSDAYSYIDNFRTTLTTIAFEPTATLHKIIEKAGTLYATYESQRPTFLPPQPQAWPGAAAHGGAAAAGAWGGQGRGRGVPRVRFHVNARLGAPINPGRGAATAGRGHPHQAPAFGRGQPHPALAPPPAAATHRGGGGHLGHRPGPHLNHAAADFQPTQAHPQAHQAHQAHQARQAQGPVFRQPLAPLTTEEPWACTPELRVDLAEGEYQPSDGTHRCAWCGDHVDQHYARQTGAYCPHPFQPNHGRNTQRRVALASIGFRPVVDANNKVVDAEPINNQQS